LQRDPRRDGKDKCSIRVPSLPLPPCLPFQVEALQRLKGEGLLVPPQVDTTDSASRTHPWSSESGAMLPIS
jgi:hypothetical protein